MLKSEEMIKRDANWHKTLVQATIYDDGEHMDSLTASEAMRLLISLQLAHDEAELYSYKRLYLRSRIIMFTAAWPIGDGVDFKTEYDSSIYFHAFK